MRSNAPDARAERSLSWCCSGVDLQRNRVERTAEDDDGRIVIQPVTFSDVSVLGHLRLTAAQPCQEG